MRVITKLDGIRWISDDVQIYTYGTHMVQHGTYQISLRKKCVEYDCDGNKRLYYQHRASFFAPRHSLYVRLNELIKRRPDRYGYRYNW